MSPRPPYYFLDFWALIIIGFAVFAFVRSRRRKRLPRTRDARPSAAHEEQDRRAGG